MGVLTVNIGHVAWRQALPVWSQVGAVWVDPGVNLDAVAVCRRH